MTIDIIEGSISIKLISELRITLSAQEKFKKFTKEDALVYVLELLDANSQWKLADLTRDEYNELGME